MVFPESKKLEQFLATLEDTQAVACVSRDGFAIQTARAVVELGYKIQALEHEKGKI